MERYVLRFTGEVNCYYLLEDKERFDQFVNADSDEQIWELLEELEEEIGDPVYSIQGVTVIDEFVGYIY